MFCCIPKCKRFPPLLFFTCSYCSYYFLARMNRVVMHVYTFRIWNMFCFRTRKDTLLVNNVNTIGVSSHGTLQMSLLPSTLDYEGVVVDADGIASLGLVLPSPAYSLVNMLTNPAYCRIYLLGIIYASSMQEFKAE